MTKPAKITLGIAAAGTGCAALALASAGVARVLWAWTAAACAVAAAAYVANRPGWLGKRDGRISIAALPALPYLVAFRIASAIMRWARGRDAPTRIQPGLLVGGRIGDADVPPDVTHVVDLVAEYAAPPALRQRAGYRSLPVLDGAHPPDVEAFLALVRELAAIESGVLVHCDSGRGRAPTLAAAVLVARGDAPDVATALARIRTARPVASPTRSDREFLATVEPALVALACDRGRRAPRGEVRRAGA